MRALLRTGLLLWIAACDCGPAEPEPVEEREASPAEERRAATLFPRGLGDRWAYRTSGGQTVRRAITATVEPPPDGEGASTSVRFGTDHLHAMRFTTGPGGSVILVSAHGETIATWLADPLRVDEPWSYTMGDAECEARYVSLDESAEVAGVALRGCAEVERACRYPAGKPFPRATTETRVERYCPGVGLVRDHGRYEPSPIRQIRSADGTVDEGELQPIQLDLHYYRVAGAPAPPLPNALDCDAILLLPSDVHAACSPALVAADAEAPEGACRFRFEANDGEARATRALMVEVRAHEAGADLEGWVGERSAPVEREGEVIVARPELATGVFDEPGAEGLERRQVETAPGVLVFAEGGFAVRIEVENQSCAIEHAQRLAPLLRSLLRR